MRWLLGVLVLAGCATVAVSPEVARLQAWSDSFEPGWQVRTGWADQGYLASMRCEPSRTASFFMGGGCAYTGAQIWLRDEVVGTKCADLLVASLFARRFSGIPFTFAQKHVSKETVELLKARGWTEDDIRGAAQSCPTNLAVR